MAGMRLRPGTVSYLARATRTLRSCKSWNVGKEKVLSDVVEGWRSNDYLASQVSSNPARFAAFCALSMHDPGQASEELRRCVKEYGMVGAMLNDFQNGEDGKPKYYDGPEYELFWKTVQELDTVVYIHPRFPHPTVIENLFGNRRALLGACWWVQSSCASWNRSFALGVGTHILGLCTNGVFDRFPDVKLAYHLAP